MGTHGQGMDAPYNASKLAMLERERKEESDAKQAVWVFLWTLFVFKIVTIGIILYIARGSAEAHALAWATTWIWLVIPAAAIAGPLTMRRRLRHQRKRRLQLQQAEWDVPEPPVVRIVDLPADYRP